MLESQIQSLQNLSCFRTAPQLNSSQKEKLLKELLFYVQKADWFTVGIMAASKSIAIANLRQLESFFDWESMNIVSEPIKDGPVFLKANQKTTDVYIRIENGLGEGILISCQGDPKKDNTETFGPFPLNIFRE